MNTRGRFLEPNPRLLEPNTKHMREIFAIGEYYHIYNRGVDKRIIFQTGSDFERFYESMFLFNDNNFRWQESIGPERDTNLATSNRSHSDRDCLVSIASFILMPNHYHFLLRPLHENGIARFMHKLNMGYTNYFNKKYDRSGSLLEGPYKAVHIEHAAYFEHILRYIHLNALDVSHPAWRDGEIEDWMLAKEKLDRYPYSSHHVYDGREQRYEVVNRDEVMQFFSGIEDYRNYLKAWAGRNSLPCQMPDSNT